MSEVGFEEVIALAALAVDEVGRAATTPGGMRQDDAYVLHVRMVRLYTNICALAAEHGNVSGQRAMALVGKQLAAMAQAEREEDRRSKRA